MNFVKFAFLLTLLQFNCFTKNKNYYNKIIGNQFSYKFPFVDSSGGKFVIKEVVGNDNFIFFYKNFIICKYFFTKINSSQNSYVEIKIPQYLIFKKNKNTGFLYDSTFNKKISSEIVEEVLRKKYFYKSHFEIDDNVELYQISEFNANEKIVKYLTKVKKDISYPDTTIYYFSKKFTDCDFSLNHYMDSLFQSKLFKVRFIFNSSTIGNSSELIPKRELSVEKNVIENVRENSLINFLERFSKEHPEY